MGGIKVNVTVTGANELIAALNRMPEATMRAAGGSLKRRGEHVIGRSQEEFVPVDVGTLRDSAFVEDPVFAGNEVTVDLGFGGAAEDYALRQHEDLSLRHPNGGQAKYLERPLLEEAPGMLAEIAADIKAELGL